MSNAKPHRRLTLTRPTGAESAPPEADDHRIAALEARCARLEALLSEHSGEGDADRFSLTDGAGRTLLSVSGDTHGATLQLLDPDGKQTAVLSVEAGGGALTLLNGCGCVIGALVLHPSGGRVVVSDPQGSPAVILEATRPDGALAIRMLAEDEPAEPPEPTPADRVTVLDTGGGLAVAGLIGAPPLPMTRGGLSRYSRGGRKAVGYYAEGMRGAVRVYDEAGGCVFSQD